MNRFASKLPLMLALLWVGLSQSTARACPDCALKNSGGIIEPQTVMAKLAFSSSTFLLLLVLFSVLGFLVWSMVKTCRELDNQSKELPLSSRGET